MRSHQLLKLRLLELMAVVMRSHQLLKLRLLELMAVVMRSHQLLKLRLLELMAVVVCGKATVESASASTSTPSRAKCMPCSVA
jgi:hypothetical protein